MISRVLLFTTILFLGAFSINAQEHAIKVNPVGLAFSIANVGYEFETKESQTLSFSGLYYNISDVSGFGAGAAYRFYFSKKDAFRGWHAGPTLAYVALEDSDNNSVGAFGLGGEIGYQWIIGNHFLIDTFLGVGYVAANSNDLNTDLQTVSVNLGVSIGYAW